MPAWIPITRSIPSYLLRPAAVLQHKPDVIIVALVGYRFFIRRERELACRPAPRIEMCMLADGLVRSGNIDAIKVVIPYVIDSPRVLRPGNEQWRPAFDVH